MNTRKNTASASHMMKARMCSDTRMKSGDDQKVRKARNDHDMIHPIMSV
tara:strand:- start:124 stop:270 length:147 start_codon:yes stop_codon:yes gene_type:complete